MSQLPKKLKRRKERRNMKRLSNRKVAEKAQYLAEDRRDNNGSPSTYDPDFARQAAIICKLGGTDLELAEAFGVTITTIWSWQTKHQEFFNALNRNKDAADERVRRALYAKSTGYSYDAEKIVVVDGAVERVKTREHVPPSDKAISFWLTNRRPQEFKERQSNEFDPNTPLNIRIIGGFKSGEKMASSGDD